MLVTGMMIATGRIALPDLDQGPGHRPAILVEDPALNDDPLPQGLAHALAREIVLAGIEPLLAQEWPGDFRQRVRQHDRRLRR